VSDLYSTEVLEDYSPLWYTDLFTYLINAVRA